MPNNKEIPLHLMPLKVAATDNLTQAYSLVNEAVHVYKELSPEEKQIFINTIKTWLFSQNK